jgi:DNA-binding protein YbaB
MHAADWLTDFDQRIQDLGARARQAKDALTGLTGTAVGGAGAVTVTVNAAGALQRISFGDRADELSRPRLAELILDTARKAHADAARRSEEALQPVVGGTAAERFLAEHLSPDPVGGTSDQPGTGAPAAGAPAAGAPGTGAPGTGAPGTGAPGAGAARVGSAAGGSAAVRWAGLAAPR